MNKSRYRQKEIKFNSHQPKIVAMKMILIKRQKGGDDKDTK
jgi:hypothetical protein